MNEFDQFIKHTLSVKNYARYTDDFVVVSEDKKYLEDLLPKITTFLSEKLSLELHPKKITIRKYHEGVDFLGSIILPHFRLIRRKTKKRMLRKLKRKVLLLKRGQLEEEKLNQSFNSYLGILSHADEYKFGEFLKNQKIF